MLHKLLRSNSIRWSVIGASVLLASCNDYHDHGCYGCGNITPSEFSNGVVAGDFNGDSVPDIVALSTVQPSNSPSPSNLKTYLATSAGVYGSPVFTPDGFNPLFIGSAD